jgi:hypothetical protein
MTCVVCGGGAAARGGADGREAEEVKPERLPREERPIVKRK